MSDFDAKQRELLLSHCRAYPKLQIQDVFKFLYQSAFGCEHMASELHKVTDFIVSEYNGIQHKCEPIVEPLDGHYSRVPLSYMDNGLDAATLGKIFVNSAKQEENGLGALKEKLNVAKSLVEDGLLPFSQSEFEKALDEWSLKGYEPIHHSAIFKESYNPSYRVVDNKYIEYLPLFAQIDKRLSKGRVILAIDGGSASGKTTLSRMIEDIYDCTVFHMDDFFLQPFQRTPQRFEEIGGNVDWERFLSRVLIPLSRDESVNLRKFDCSTMTLAEAEKISPRKLVVVEGVYSMHRELEKYFDYSVFLNVSQNLQRERILHRNSPCMAQRFFEEWIPLENKYFAKTDIKSRCAMTIEIKNS